MNKPLSSAETKKKIEAFRKNSEEIQMFKLSDLSDSVLRQMRSEDAVWVLRAVDHRW
jgi:hypothetical protein